jgi:hypothetical protein
MLLSGPLLHVRTMAEPSPSITPPPDLVRLWQPLPVRERERLVDAYRLGADEELEACCEWLIHTRVLELTPASLRAARRPKPPSLKQQALTLLDDISDQITAVHENGIRRALEALDD